MTKEQKEVSDAYRSLFGLSPTTTQNEEESPEDKDRRLTKEIQDSEQRLQGWRDKRTSVLSYTPFHKRLKAVENFLRNQEISPLLEGYQPGYFSKGDRERIRFMSAPRGELRIAFPHEPIFPSFQKAPKNSASILYFVNGPDPNHICRLEIYEDERDAVSQLEKVEWEIVCEEEKLSTLKREWGDNRMGAKIADISLPSGEPRETAPSETPDEQPLAEVSASEKIVEGSVDHEAGEEKEEDTDAESTSAPTVTIGREDLEREKTAKTETEEFTPRDLEKGTRGKLIGIALSGQRSSVNIRKIVACMGKTKADCPSTTYPTFKDWYRENNKLFHKFLFRLRKEGKEWEKDFGQRIPDNYYESYK